ncbi:hypothetical protein ACJIZ3_010184 [Penstemon smallii]|uniref:Pentatricopeptide repeat-containing protein n=1 Tax=Penstemon smallii TaxID=265156 RepID=A0ABD3TFZ9_9LAMI
MIERAFKPQTNTILPLLTRKCKHLNQFKQIHAQLLILNLIQDSAAVAPLISLAADPDFTSYAHAVFQNLRHRTYYILVQQHDQRVSLNLDMGKAQELFDETPMRDVVLWTTMIDGYGKMGDIEKARLLFNEMPERNVISWSAIMAAYSRASDFREVLCLYKIMEDIGVKPNESILVSAVTACAHLGALAQGLYNSNPILATALVDMYSKSGCVQLALSVFEEIPKKDSGAWNAIISGVAMKGDAVKSLELTEHFACVVDLLARSGKVEDAEKFVNEIGACRIHGKVDIGNTLWKRIAEKGVADYRTHVLAYNMYKEAGWDDESKRVRRLIKERQMKKKPGCSAIEVNGIVEEFIVGNISHPQGENICKMVDSLICNESCAVQLYEYG